MKAIFGIFLLFTATLSIAQPDSTYGQWTVSSDASSSIAITKNDSGSSLGYLCMGDASTCGPFLSVPLGCEVKAQYPVLINSAAGASSASLTCFQLGQNKYYLINETDLFNSAIESGGDVGFAFPAASGKFIVVRFNTAGAIPAIREAVSRQAPPPTKKPTTLNEEL